MHPRICLNLLVLLLSACAPAAASTPIPATVTQPGLSPADTPSTVPTTVPAIILPSPTPAVQICSPLAGFSLDEIPALVSNPYTAPAPGSDMPHEGIDLADTPKGDGIAISGRQVQAALSGTVAWVIHDRFPYGNALVVETSLENLPPSWLAALNPPVPGPVTPDPALTCPPYAVPPEWSSPRYSLYIVYAHLLAAPTLQPGQVLTCGQPIGQVGQSGNALNPHLHFEVRIGPSAARFTSMAHYDNSATLDEMASYCTWRVSGWFRLLDPLTLLALQP